MYAYTLIYLFSSRVPTVFLRGNAAVSYISYQSFLAEAYHRHDHSAKGERRYTSLSLLPSALHGGEWSASGTSLALPPVPTG
jgi:hypothetical protein